MIDYERLFSTMLECATRQSGESTHHFLIVCLKKDMRNYTTAWPRGEWRMTSEEFVFKMGRVQMIVHFKRARIAQLRGMMFSGGWIDDAIPPGRERSEIELYIAAHMRNQ